jgi:hypothetical protein
VSSKLLKRLIKAKMSLKWVDKEGHTVLWHAVKLSNKGWVRKLVDAGADPREHWRKMREWKESPLNLAK